MNKWGGAAHVHSTKDFQPSQVWYGRYLPFGGPVPGEDNLHAGSAEQPVKHELLDEGHAFTGSDVVRASQMRYGTPRHIVEAEIDSRIRRGRQGSRATRVVGLDT